MHRRHAAYCLATVIAVSSAARVTAADSLTTDTILALWRAVPKSPADRVEVRRVLFKGTRATDVKRETAELNRYAFSPTGRSFRTTRGPVEGGETLAGESDWVELSNLNYTADLANSRPGGPLTVREFRRRTGPLDAVPERWATPWLVCGNVWLPDWLASGKFAVASTEPRPGGGVRVNFRNPKVRASPPYAGREDTVPAGWLDVDPARDGRVLAYQFDFRSSSSTGTERGTFEYADLPGPPRLDRVTVEIPEQKFSKNNLTIASREVRTYRYDPDPVSDAEFYLSHYGLPEPPGVDAPRRPVWKWIGLGAAAVLAALIVRFALKRRQE
jgi:hypothetical protein